MTTSSGIEATASSAWLRNCSSMASLNSDQPLRAPLPFPYTVGGGLGLGQDLQVRLVFAGELGRDLKGEA